MSYYSSQAQRVTGNSVQSHWQLVTSGFHQGTILGTVFFNIFANDLCK